MNTAKMILNKRYGKFAATPQPETFLPSEYLAYLNHRAEIKRQFWALVWNCPRKLFKFLRQRRELMAETDQKLFEEFYLQAES